ncbi:MAG: LytR C-terminal domain-containing protein [Candidatus Cloacimonadaceae bacterium]|nr:LytR C-terminal domain-containing protein [Candidatus Cloacimonadota bacterium]MDD5624204.1 LytR C-terminal domain-containing protein [Candidatus Cloacimonadota bacterium]MDY0111548.1 LytR C-terminal domain-containing protein [Candidatus Syntrophosphaera sp.]
MTAKHSSNNWFSSKSWLWILIVILAGVLITLIYIRFISPKGDFQDLDEKNLPAIKVIIKNGCGVENLATDYANYIRNKNIEVIRISDTSHPIYNKSLIEVKQEDLQDLKRLQKMTGIQRYTLAIDSSSEAPFIIILGADYDAFLKH